MSQLKSWSSTAEGASLLPQGKRTRSSNALFAANARAQSEVGAAPETGKDKRGHALRILRLQQQIDPAELATQACISLRQLFQLETGGTSLFYSDGLRNQAGRRVASILGANWDELKDAPLPEDTHIRLVQMPGPAARAPHAATPQPLKPNASQPDNVPGILMKPAIDTLVMNAEPTAQLTPPGHDAQPTEARRGSPSRRLAACLFFGLLAYGLWVAAETFWGIRL